MGGHKFRGLDPSPGWINRKFRDIDTALRELRAEKRLAASSFANVPPGSIPVSALSSTTASGYVYQTATGFSVPLAGADLIASTVTVPHGFTGCVVMVTGRVFAYNSTLSTDYLYARPTIGTANGNALPIQALTTAAALNTAPLSAVLSGLNGGDTFTVRLWAATSVADWPSDPTNTADLSGVVLWF